MGYLYLLSSVCVCVLLGVSVAASLGVAAMFAVLSLIAACCIYARRQRVRRFVCRSCARLHSNYTYRQVALASSPRPFWGSWPPRLVAWHSGRTSVSGRRTFPVLRSTCS